uniref:Uncharacterized protein n=1 Tax=Arcella intermedia TaxID=1963864 RepID=A0A6B2LV32_9EUKA
MNLSASPRIFAPYPSMPLLLSLRVVRVGFVFKNSPTESTTSHM